MSSEKSFLEQVKNQFSSIEDIKFTKMFGEYAVYYKDKVVAMICDNQFLVKITEAGKKYIGNYKTGLPYPGAKECFLIDEKLEDSDFCEELIRITYPEIPMPKKKKKKKD